jgi:hypothetical protein
MRTLKELAQEAIDVQDASNVVGVVASYATALQDLSKYVKGSSEIAKHPINRLWASKIQSLAGMGIGDNDRFGFAHAACQELTKPTLEEAQVPINGATLDAIHQTMS